MRKVICAFELSAFNCKVCFGMLSCQRKALHKTLTIPYIQRGLYYEVIEVVTTLPAVVFFILSCVLTGANVRNQ